MLLTVGNTSSSTAYDVNATGQILGQAVVDGEPTRAVLSTTALTHLGSLNGTFNAALGISHNSTVVGWSTYATFHAFIWRDGTISDAGGSASV